MMLLLDGRQPGRRGLRATELGLLLLTALGSSHYLARPSLVCRVVKKGADVMDKQGIEEFRNLLLVREIESALEWDPWLC